MNMQFLVHAAILIRALVPPPLVLVLVLQVGRGRLVTNDSKFSWSTSVEMTKSDTMGTSGKEKDM
jgi:hypothetical protein